MPAMLYLSQKNPTWKDVRIGNTSLTLENWGCLITCLSMLSSYFGCYMTPAQIARYPGAFNSNGEFIWARLVEMFKGKIKFEWRQYSRDDVRIRASLLSSPHTAVVLNVNNGKHWVVCVGVNDQGARKDYFCADPIDGKKAAVSARYPNIKGSAHVITA